MNFNFLNFCTKYKSEGSNNINLAKQACFGAIFHSRIAYPKNKYTIYVYDDKTEVGDNNCCLLSEEQIINHMEEGKKYHKYEYTLKRTDQNDGYIITVDLKGACIYHKFLLTWFRYLYEFPFNICLWEAYKIKDIYSFKRLSTLNLFNLISASFRYSGWGTDIHCIGYFYEVKNLMSNTEIKKRLKKVNAVNSIFPSHSVGNVPGYNYISGSCKDMEYLKDEKEFAKRVKLYRKNLKAVKSLKK